MSKFLKTQSLKISSLGREAGATMLEFVFIAPAVVFGLLLIIDLGRILTIQTLLNSGAQEALNVAVKVEYMDKTTVDGSVASAELGKVVDKVIASSIRLPAATLLEDLRATGTQAKRDKSAAYIEQVAIVRPGESLLPGADPTEGDGHPFYQCETVPSGLAFVDNFKSCPLGVRIIARVRTFTPFIPSLTITGEAFGFREVGYQKIDIPEVVS